MSWWNDLWLNEGFATYMEYTSLQTVYPKLDLVSWFSSVPPDIQYMYMFCKVLCFMACLCSKVCVYLQGNLFLSVRFRALDKDALNSSHAVSTEVNAPEQVEEMFDSVSYEKVHFFSCYCHY